MNRFVFALLFALASAAAAQGRAMTVTDMMAFRLIKGATISADGKWVAFEARPDRGDGDGHVVSTDGEARHEVERGRAPVFSDDSRWVAFQVVPRLTDTEAAKKGDKPKPGVAVMDLETGAVSTFASIERFAFTKASTVLVLQHHAPRKPKGDKETEAAPKPTAITVHFLDTRGESRLADITEWALDPRSKWLVTVHTPRGAKTSKLIARDLTASLASRSLVERAKTRIARPTFTKEFPRLAWLEVPLDDKGKPGDATLSLWNGGDESPSPVPVPGRTIPIHSPLEWSEDGARLFFGTKRPRAPGPEPIPADEERQRIEKLLEKLLEKRAVDVWHHDDPFIRPHQKKQWKTEKKRTYRAVLHVAELRVVQLADAELPDVAVSKNATTALGTSDVPYRKARTWDLPRRDVYTVDLTSGERTRVVTAVRSTAKLSPGGTFVVYYASGHWYLWDVAKKRARNLTQDLDVPFANELHDYPYPAPGYGDAGFEQDESAVYIYDRYDVWCFPTNGDKPVRITKGEGRQARRTSRLVTLDKDGKSLAERTGWIATTYDEQTKAWGFGRVGDAPPHHGPHRFKVVGKAKDSDEILYTRESYGEYPDLWVTKLDGNPPKKLTDLEKQTDGIAWGSAELVHWTSQDGAPLDGVLIKPGNYEAGKRYPVVVYFYRKFSQRLNEFNEVVVNHRPCFPFYASNGYAVFLPDVDFEIGQPGASATRCLVPGIQKLVELGIADPRRIGLHGHSWSGYQTAFVITQTDMFRTAVAGAPVSNMTSAYGGIRWGTGLSRQFQYERSQSRIGGTLWDARDLYIENSPVFFADRINTPLLIQFGDEDGAVPWYQGIELYMAMRRLEKPCVFLQYRGEPHHLKKYPNKLDYTLKMKEWFDHYLKDTPAPTWISTGVPYSGK